jgi:hypothetical protein
MLLLAMAGGCLQRIGTKGKADRGTSNIERPTLNFEVKG